MKQKPAPLPRRSMRFSRAHSLFGDPPPLRKKKVSLSLGNGDTKKGSEDKENDDDEEEENENDEKGGKKSSGAKKSSASPRKSKGSAVKRSASWSPRGVGKSGRVKKSVYEAHPPYTKKVPVYSIEHPPPVMIDRGIQVDQDVDRFDILLAVTDVEFDPETGVPLLEGLTAREEEEFPYVIEDKPTKCYCNNNENEPYVSPYVKVVDLKHYRRAVQIGKEHAVG